MKLKKLILGLLLTTLLTGCSAKKKQAEPVLNKNQVIQLAKKDFKSGQVKQTIMMGTDTTKQIVTTNTNFGAEPTVFHLNYQTQYKGKTQNSEQWVDQNNLYLNGQSSWYKTNLAKTTGHNYAQVVSAIMDNKLLKNPPAALLKAYKMKKDKDTYTLTAKLNDPKIMKKAAEPIYTTNSQSKKQNTAYKNLEQYGKYKSMQVKLVVKNKKLTAFSSTINLRINRSISMAINQSYSNFGRQDFLQLPNKVLGAKPLPQNKNHQK